MCRISRCLLSYEISCWDTTLTSTLCPYPGLGFSSSPKTSLESSHPQIASAESFHELISSCWQPCQLLPLTGQPPSSPPYFFELFSPLTIKSKMWKTDHLRVGTDFLLLGSEKLPGARAADKKHYTATEQDSPVC